MLFLCQGTNYFKILFEKSTVYASFTGGKVEYMIIDFYSIGNLRVAPKFKYTFGSKMDC